MVAIHCGLRSRAIVCGAAPRRKRGSIHMAKNPLVNLQPLTTGAAVVMAGAVVVDDAQAAAASPASDPFADTDRDWTQDEVIEVREPRSATWFDELEESVSPVLPPPEKR